MSRDEFPPIVESEQEMQDLLSQALDDYLQNQIDDGVEINYQVNTFEREGLLTRDKGLVARINGDVYQIGALDEKVVAPIARRVHRKLAETLLDEGKES